VARDRKRTRRDGPTRPRRALPSSLPDGTENVELPETGIPEEDWPSAADAFPQLEALEGDPVSVVAADPFGNPTNLRARERVQSDERTGGGGLGGFLRGCVAELQRVQWPDRRQVAQATGVVLGFVVVAAAFLGLADEISQKIVNLIL
jgi:preprotein translocase subunit SecE